MNMLLPTAAAMVNGILVGLAIVATRFVIGQSSPISLALLRYFIGFCCLLPPILRTRQMRFERCDLIPIGLLGTLQFGAVIFLLNFALQYISSSRAALIFSSFPLKKH
jgi:drug/metabolite transporter (DMT)-like permease